MDKDVKGHCSSESYSCILSRTVDIFDGGTTPLSVIFFHPSTSDSFSCSEPVFWTACVQAARAGVWGDPLFTCHLLQQHADSLRKPHKHHLQGSRKITYKTWLNGCIRYRCILMYTSKFLLTKKWQSAAGQNNHLSLPSHFSLQRFYQPENPLNSDRAEALGYVFACD